MRFCRQLALVPTLLLAACLYSQQPKGANDEGSSKPFILHAYANLVQVPTLAVDPDFNPLPPLDRNQFSIRLDSGPAFHPTKIHMEGEEPLTLAILIDASGNQDNLVRGFAPALAQMARISLKPQDRVSIYALDCGLVRSALNVPGSPEALESAVDRALAAPTLHNGKGRGACGRHLHTWNAAAQIVNALSNLPGRRVLLLISSGYDSRSTFTPVTLRHYADENSVSIFAIRDLVRYEGDFGVARANFLSEMYFAIGNSSEDNFTELCESNGGLIITLSRQQLAPGLERFVSMLRGRYILEFPRPDARDPGIHRIDVTIPSRPTFLVTAGVSVPLSDEAIEADPNTIHSSPSPAVLGKRRPISQNP